MINIAEVIKINNEIEEEITVIINDVEVTVFAGYVPYDIEIGKKYPVEISLFVDDFTFMPNCDNDTKVIREGDSFKYILIGYLNENGQFDVGFLIEDEYLKTYEYLYGKYFALKVDRIDVEFL